MPFTEFSPLALVAVSATSLSAASAQAFAATLVASTIRGRHMEIFNQTDKDVIIRLGSTDWAYLKTGISRTFNFGQAESVLPAGTTIKAYSATAITTGQIVISDFY